jgi:hypothetical protein
VERIVLEVDDTVGKVYRNFSPATRQQFNETVSLMIKKAVNNVTFTDYSKLLDDTGSDAIKNGLTPDVIEALLASND